jgi:spore maturation protein CgeB
MKILYASLKYEYGRPDWGLAAIDYQHFYGSLQAMPNVEAEHFPIDEKMAELGRDGMNEALIQRVKESQPDLLFTFLFTEEIKKETIRYITESTKTKTFNWFADDHWRFPIFSRNWAPLFTAVSTTDSLAVAKYRAIGVSNIIKTQWAANTQLFKPANKDSDRGEYKITFVGKNYGKREGYIKLLQARDLPAKGYGKGWPSGVVEFEKMLEIFSFSKINLNFAESPFMSLKDRAKAAAKLFVKKELGEYKINVQNFFPNLQSAIQGQRRQIKTRIFEVPACGGFMLTSQPDDNLEEYYTSGKEIETFSSVDELTDKCSYYLTHDTEREAIAKAGLDRTLKDHTFAKRFEAIFKFMNLA